MAGSDASPVGGGGPLTRCALCRATRARHAVNAHCVLQFEIEFHDDNGGGRVGPGSDGLDSGSLSRAGSSIRRSGSSRESSVWRRTPSMRRPGGSVKYAAGAHDVMSRSTVD